MTKFKRWLYTKFLPDYCRVELQDENKRLLALIQRQKQEIDQLNAYISGLENGIRNQRRIVIRNEVGK
ncbi:hypothetical protein [Oscillibacter sp.]|uniref:hypothetical protein n=1 Tax=Oscillibacter sp. TaxID=1945593 RepID=UPI00289E4CC4|nr:hypothetical protein [Oscillibacter sp.]